MAEEVHNQKSLNQNEPENTKEICKELNLILKSAGIRSFIVPDWHDRDLIKNKAQNLSFEERAKLLINFVAYPGMALFDPGNIFRTLIKIDDNIDKKRPRRPLAYLIFNQDADFTRVEVIDILESVRQNALAVGHPVIIAAIQHWQNIILWEKFVNNETIYSQIKSVTEWNHHFHGRYIEAADESLKEISKALSSGISKRKVPSINSFLRHLKNLNIENRNNYLYVAWERLKSNVVNPTNDLAERVYVIENYLRRLPKRESPDQINEFDEEFRKYGYLETDLSISSVLDFLKNDGSRFVYSEKSEFSQRPRWSVFKNAFLKWYFNKKGSTIDQYKKSFKEPFTTEEPYLSGFFGNSSPVSFSGLMNEILSQPLIHYCKPLKLPAYTNDFEEIRQLVRQTVTK